MVPIPQYGDRTEADYVSEYIDFAKGPTHAVDQRRGEEAGVIPVTNLPDRQTSQSAHMFGRERE
jgi:hypothetical protein